MLDWREEERQDILLRLEELNQVVVDVTDAELDEIVKWAGDLTRSGGQAGESHKPNRPLPVHALDVQAIKEVFRINRTRLFEMVRKGEFPAPVRLGGKANLWLYDEVVMWFDDQVKAERGVTS